VAKDKWHKEAIPVRHPAEAEAVPVVADAGIATVGVGDGRMIPLLILDTSKRPDIEDMVKAHHAMDGQGDVKAQWGRPDTFFDRGMVSLILTFEKPSYCLIILRLDIGKYGGLVDQIIRSQGVYIQPGRPGDRLSTTFDNPRVLAEVPSREFQPEWDRMLRKAMRKRFQREHGLGRSEAKLATERFISEWRDLSSKRIKGPVEDPAE
jgi:hypothetical protein